MTETIHATADIITAVSDAHGDTAGALFARIKAVRSATTHGVKIATLTADLKAASDADPSITAVSSTILGYAHAASEMIEHAHITLSSLKATDAATVYRGAKRVGTKAFRTAVREALKTLTDDATAADRLSVLLSVSELAASTVRETAPATREAHSQGGTSDAASGETADTVTAPASAPASPVDGIRAAVRYLQNGGELTADMMSAIAELTDAASKARKFAAQRKPATV